MTIDLYCQKYLQPIIQIKGNALPFVTWGTTPVVEVVATELVEIPNLAAPNGGGGVYLTFQTPTGEPQKNPL